MTDIKLITAWDHFDTINAIVKEDGKKKHLRIKDFDWYFAVTEEDFGKIPRELLLKYHSMGIISSKEIVGGYVKIFGKRYKNTVVDDIKYNIHSLRKSLTDLGVKCKEMDLPVHKRWQHDNDIPIETDLKVVFFDIETDDTIGNIQIGRDRILSIAFHDTENNTHYITNEDERTLLIDAIKFIRKYDVIVGWNSGKFDLPYIQERCLKHGIEYDWRQTVHIDLMLRLIKLFASISGLLGLSGFSLNEVSKTFLDKEKVKFEGKVIDLYQTDPETLQKYNQMDVELLYELNKKINAIPLMVKECEWTGTYLNKFYIGEILDNYIIREAKKAGRYLNSKPTWEEAEELEKIDISGAYVMKPTPGKYRNVNIFDFKSMYPSIIITYNIGEDSLDEELSKKGDDEFVRFLDGRKVEDVPIDEYEAFLIEQKRILDPKNEYVQTANNAFFHKKESLIPGLVEELLKQRKVFKDKLDSLVIDSPEYRTARAEQEVVKEMANSIFGITCDRASRFFNKYVSEGITLTGQYLNRICMRFAQTHGANPIYGDTDSIFLELSEEASEEMEKVINEELTKYVKAYNGLEKSTVYLEHEKIFGVLLMLSKKKYTGNLIWMDGKKVSKIFSRGIELVKKDTIKYTKRHIEDLVNILVKEEKTLDEIKDWVEDRQKDILEGELDPKDLSITVRIARSPSTYKTKLLHVRIADDRIQRGLMQDVQEGKTNAARITYIITQSKPKLDGVHIDEFKGEWDRTWYWNVKVMAPFLRLLEVAHPEFDWNEYLIKPPKKERKKKNV